MADRVPEQSSTAVLEPRVSIPKEPTGRVINEIDADHPLWEVPEDEPKDPIVVGSQTSSERTQAGDNVAYRRETGKEPIPSFPVDPKDK